MYVHTHVPYYIKRSVWVDGGPVESIDEDELLAEHMHTHIFKATYHPDPDGACFPDTE